MAVVLSGMLLGKYTLTSILFAGMTVLSSWNVLSYHPTRQYASAFENTIPSPAMR